MKNIAIFTALILFSFQLSFSQNKPHTLLWEISKKGLSQKSYLFGTFHEVNPDFFDSIKVANAYLKKSKVLLVETYDEPGNPSTTNKSEQTKTSAIMHTWKKADWDSVLNVTTEKDKFVTYTKSSYGDEEIYKLSPQLLTFVLMRNYFQGICDTVNRKSFDLMDNRIINIGLKNNLKVIGLETDQINIINTKLKADVMFSDSNSINTVLDLMDYITKGNTNTDIAKMLFDYKKFEVDYQLNIESKSAEQILTVRNDNWMKTIPGFINQNPCFIAVGFRHLTLKNGLIGQLRRLGYSVTPVKI